MNITLNHTDEELSPELADALVAPLLDYVEAAPNDDAAKAVIGLLHTVAHESSPELRELFVSDVTMKIYSKTFAYRDAAMAFAA